MVKGQLASFAMTNGEHWAPEGRAETRSRRALLLPGFDEYTVAYRDRGAILGPAHARHAAGMDILRPAIVVRGCVVGTWTRTMKQRSVRVEPSPFTPLDDAPRRAVATAARRYAAFLGLSVDAS